MKELRNKLNEALEQYSLSSDEILEVIKELENKINEEQKRRLENYKNET